MKINFNVHSKAAWTTLLSAILTAVISILGALGITVRPDMASTITTLIGTILSLLTVAGVLYAPTDAPKDGGHDEDTK